MSLNWQFWNLPRYFLPKIDEIINKIDKIDKTPLLNSAYLSKSFLSQNLPKNDIYGQKQKNWTSSLNFANSNQSRYQISAETDNFDFLD